MPPKAGSSKKATPRKAKTATTEVVENTSFSESLLGFDPGGFGVQVTQVDTLFANMRNYFVSNMRQPLSQAYAEIGVVQTIVDVPVDDAMRGGIEIKSKQLSPDEIADLQAEMEAQDDIGVMSEALKWDRLFGGAGVLIIDGTDPMLPLNPSVLNESSPLCFKAVDMWELFFDRQVIDGDGEPLDGLHNEYFNYYGKRVHRSRVLLLKGKRAPSFIRAKLRGWGMSVVEVLVRSINQYLKATELTFEVLDEFKLDVYKLKGLNNTLMASGGKNKVLNRVQTANQQKNFQNAIALDAEDEFDHKELSFAGISEVMTGIRMAIASDLRMPLTKVFGISATGFNSGEDDIENYNAMVEGTVRTKCKHHLINMVKLRCQQKFGMVPDDITIGFKPLRVMSSEQEEAVKNSKFSRLMQALQSGAMSPKEFKDACNQDNLLVVQVEATDDLIAQPGQDEEEAEGSSGGKAADKEDKPKEPKTPKDPE